VDAVVPEERVDIDTSSGHHGTIYLKGVNDGDQYNGGVKGTVQYCVCGEETLNTVGSPISITGLS